MVNLFQDLGIPESKLHMKYKLLRDGLAPTGEKAVVQDWADGFVDRDNKFVEEFQKTFHSAFWELYLFRVLSEAGFVIDFSKNRPDFLVASPYEFNIEAVVSEIKQGGREEATRELDDILSMIEPAHENRNFKNLIDEAITRYSNSIQSKTQKFISEYSNCNWIKRDVPFVIGLASYAQVNYGKEYHYPLMALLYGEYFNPESESFNQVDSIIKPGTSSDIPLGIFRNGSMSDISAIVFSCTVTLGKLTALSISQKKSEDIRNFVFNVRHDFDEPHYKIQVVSPECPEELSDGLFVFHNPNARVKLPFDAFNRTNAVQITYENNQLRLEGNNLPIVSRLNMLDALPQEAKNMLFKETFERFNRGYSISKFRILDIDIELKEVTLEDQWMPVPLPVIIDLSDEDIDLINRNGISVGDMALSIIKGEFNDIGMAETYRLISIDKIDI